MVPAHALPSSVYTSGGTLLQQWWDQSDKSGGTIINPAAYHKPWSVHQVGLYQDLLKHHSTFCDGGSLDEEGNMLSCRHVLPAHCAIQRLVSNL